MSISSCVTSKVMSRILTMYRVTPMILWTSLIPLVSSGRDVSSSLANYALVPYMICREGFRLNYSIDRAICFSL